MAETIEVDLEQRLRQYMPAMFLLLDEKNLKKRQWRNLNKKFVNEHYERVKKYEANNNHLLVEANFFDLINSTINGNEQAFRLVGYFDILFKALNNNLLPEEKITVRDTLYHVLIHMDHKFRNYIGELAILNNAVEKRAYSLVGIEVDKIAQNNTADFTLRKNDGTDTIELVEVVNIHLGDANYLREAIEQRITKKLGEKTAGEKDYKPFTLVPVIWAPVAILRELETLYKSGNGFATLGVHEPVAYCNFYSTEKQLPIYRFAKITTLFPVGDIEVKWIS